jgi:hypothetical protein
MKLRVKRDYNLTLSVAQPSPRAGDSVRIRGERRDY